MYNVTSYVNDYGNLSFTEKPFCDEDNVALCMSFYMPLDKVVSPSFDKAPVPFDKACNDLFALRGNKHKPVGLVLVKGISKLLMAMAAQKRYSEMQVVACTDTFENKPAVQFNAVTYLLPTSEIVVVFRGTDDTLTGWKEDYDILASPNGIPSEPLSVAYLAEVAKRYDGDIIVCGHSKGAYVAQYAVLNSEKEVRDRVKLLYNNDGPGFATYDYYHNGAYQELLPRYKHFVPENSFIGMMLMHDDDYKAVKSSKLTGPMQHDLLTWKFNGDKLVYSDDTKKMSKIADLTLYKMVKELSPEQITAVDTALTAVIDGIGQRGLLDVKSHVGASLKGGKRGYKELDEETKKLLKATMKDSKRLFKEAKRAVKNGEYSTAAQRASE